MCRITERVNTCGHYSSTITYCTKKRLQESDPCDDSTTVSSTTGCMCGWSGCNKKAATKRDGPKGKPDVLTLGSGLMW
jgi:hypothetical protein